MNGPALSRTGGTLTLTDDLVSITSGGRLTDTGAGPLLAFSAGTVNIGNAAGDQLFVVNGVGSQAALAGPVLSATGTALSLTGNALVEVSTSGTLTDATTTRLLSLSGGSLTLGAATSAVLVNTAGTATLAGGLLDTTGTDITAVGDFVRALGGGRVVVIGSSAPLLSLTGGTHQFGAAGNIYRLSGTATAIDPVSGLLLGTEEPIQAAGSLFESVGATATTQRAVRLDVALLQASAPLLSLRNNGAVAGGLTTTSNAIDLTSRAKLNATAPVIALDGSRITVTNASLVNVAGGSYLGVTGNLLSVANGSLISVTGGTLLFAAGGSVVNISGALLSFGGSGSTVTREQHAVPLHDHRRHPGAALRRRAGRQRVHHEPDQERGRQHRVHRRRRRRGPGGRRDHAGHDQRAVDRAGGTPPPVSSSRAAAPRRAPRRAGRPPRPSDPRGAWPPRAPDARPAPR